MAAPAGEAQQGRPPRATTVTGSPVHHQIYPNLLPQPLLTQLSPRVTGT